MIEKCKCCGTALQVGYINKTEDNKPTPLFGYKTCTNKECRDPEYEHITKEEASKLDLKQQGYKNWEEKKSILGLGVAYSDLTEQQWQNRYNVGLTPETLLGGNTNYKKAREYFMLLYKKGRLVQYDSNFKQVCSIEYDTGYPAAENKEETGRMLAKVTDLLKEFPHLESITRTK